MKTLWQTVVAIAGGALILCLAVARPLFFSPMRSQEEHQVDPAALKAHVEALSQRFVPRDDEHPEILHKAAAYIAEKFRSAGAKVNDQEFKVYGNSYKNVIAEFGPDGSDTIVVGAHYDTAGDQPGADDNASGVAGVIELGRLLVGVPLRSKVILAAYALEEPPHFRTENMGSAVHARSLRARGLSVTLMISLEMIGYFSEEPNSQGFPMPLLRLFYPSRGNFILVVDRLFSNRARELKQAMSAASDLPVYSLNAPAIVPGVDFSDHLNFWEQGYPAVMVTDTSFYRNPAYHSRLDIADRLDYVKMAQVVRGVFHYLMKNAAAQNDRN
jgi:Zn-dependent M28 family amino/carboxypeptidase